MSKHKHFQTCPEIVRGRGKAKATLRLVEAARTFLQTAHPTTVRGVCYRLFVDGIIASMSGNATGRVSRILTDAREDDEIPWEWIVDATRDSERVPSWDNPAAYVAAVRKSYRRDFWSQQPTRVEVWSEKNTIRGVVKPVLDEYGVGFRVLHGFGSATMVNEIAEDNGSPLIVLYIGDWDCSGMCMSERDLPKRLARYGGAHVSIRRIALNGEDVADPQLPSFPAKAKLKDTRYRWFVKHYGRRCWELDAMNPNTLRDRVKAAIVKEIEPEAWARCVQVQEAEQESLQTLLDKWTTQKKR